MLRWAKREEELTLEHVRKNGEEFVSWGAKLGSGVERSTHRAALADIRGNDPKKPLYKSGDDLAGTLHIKDSAGQIERCRGLIHVHGDDPGMDFPMEIMVRNRHLPDSYLGAVRPCSNKFASGEAMMPAGTVQHIFFVDGTGNGAHPEGLGETLDVLGHSQIEPLLDALKPYKKRPFSSEHLTEDGLYMVSESTDEENFRFGLDFLSGEAPGEPRNGIILYAGHVVYPGGEPKLVIRDRLLPVERLLALDSKPRLVILVGCGPERDDLMGAAARRLMRPGATDRFAYGVICAAYPVQFDIAAGLIRRLLKKMVLAEGREHLDELLRQARREALRRVGDADRDILAFRYFGSCAYRPQLLIRRCNFRRAVAGCAAVLLTLAVLWAVRSPFQNLFAHPPAPGALDAGTGEAFASGAADAVGTPIPADAEFRASTAPDAAPSFGDVMLNPGGTMRVEVRDCPESVALGVFLQVEGDASWYCKDAGMAREGDAFTVRWRAEGTSDDQAKKLALFLYPKSEVHTTTSYALVEAASVASKLLTGLTR